LVTLVFEIQAIGDYVGPRFATYTNDQGIGGRYLLNLQAGAVPGLGRRADDQFVNALAVGHVGDVDRQLQVLDWNSYAQPPRMGFITLSGAF
jgi:iron complex outermembrane receptor protein